MVYFQCFIKVTLSAIYTGDVMPLSFQDIKDFFVRDKNPYTRCEGSIYYLDGSSLKRPLKMGTREICVMLAFVVIAISISVYVYVSTTTSMSEAAARSQATTEENLAREVSYGVPYLRDLIWLNNSDIIAAEENQGYRLYNMGGADGSSEDGTMRFMKIPSDMTLTETASMMAGGGISNLDAAQAALLLKGSWTFEVQRGENIEMCVRYVDFDAESIDAAIDWAVGYEGFNWDNAVESDYGVDAAGNTFRAGTIDFDGYTYGWQVSAIDLSDVYDIQGLPEDAVYVGIRYSTM